MVGKRAPEIRVHVHSRAEISVRSRVAAELGSADLTPCFFSTACWNPDRPECLARDQDTVRTDNHQLPDAVRPRRNRRFRRGRRQRQRDCGRRRLAAHVDLGQVDLGDGGPVLGDRAGALRPRHRRHAARDPVGPDVPASRHRGFRPYHLPGGRVDRHPPKSRARLRSSTEATASSPRPTWSRA